jgi:hypothetical protein
MVIGDFERALVGFREGRLVTEGAVFVNGVIATLLVLCSSFVLRPGGGAVPGYGLATRRLAIAGAAAVFLFTGLFTTAVRSVYRDRHDGWGRPTLRLGPDADWRVRPLLRSESHR